MTAFNMTEDQAITAITVGIDFSVSQVTQQLPHALTAGHRNIHQHSACIYCRVLEESSRSLCYHRTFVLCVWSGELREFLCIWSLQA